MAADLGPVTAPGETMAETGPRAITSAGGADTLQAASIVAGYLDDLRELIGRIDIVSVVRVVNLLRDVRDRGGRVFIAGNGGSAAAASHWANDLGKATKASGCAPIRVMSLVDNVPWLTALANDEGYERVFSGQIENFAQPGDVLVVISASGNSPNLLRAVEWAREHATTTVGLLGFDGGALRGLVNEYIWLPTAQGAYQLAEDGHAMLCHMLTTCLMMDRPRAELTSETENPTC